MSFKHNYEMKLVKNVNVAVTMKKMSIGDKIELPAKYESSARTAASRLAKTASLGFSVHKAWNKIEIVRTK